jgi:hypothetical protein
MSPFACFNIYSFTYEKMDKTIDRLFAMHCSSFLHYTFNKLKSFVMKKNMGTADRVIRIVLAVVFAALYFTGIVTGTWALVLLVLGGIFLLTSLVGFCPLYTLVGVNTCPKVNVE